MEEFIAIVKESTYEIVEKKSKFIANAFYVENTKEAEDIIKKLKKKYHDARHNCIAYRVFEDEKIVEKASDDGEPSGTAGAPMLAILNKNNLCNILIIVTRYFGGILLGTGGLVRAYSDATIKALESAKKIHKIQGIEMECEVDYNNFDIFKYYCNNNQIKITNTQYLDVILCNIELEEEKKPKMLNDIEKNNINIRNLKFLSKKIIDKSVEK